MIDLSAALSQGLFDFRNPSGTDFAQRCEPFREWVDTSSEAGLFQFLRYHRTSPSVRSEVVGWGGQSYEGINLASQDYLGLARHPDVVRAAIEACLEHGTHSAGSEPMGGGLGEAKELERELGDYVRHEHSVLFPTGWAAGYGAIKALVRPADHIVLDALAHDCLQHGARAATTNVTLFSHNDLPNLEKRLERIRKEDPTAAILVVTESLFSMDSDHPDFPLLVSICRRHGAQILVDVAHDLGVLGPDGRGVLEEQGVLGDIDFLIGSFSKAFACIGGFFATHSKAATYYVRAYSGSYTFSNYLIPVQIAAIRAALRIIASPEGQQLRKRTLRAAAQLRSGLEREGLQVLGRLSPLVLPLVGAEPVARLAYRTCLENGLILNNIEFPACRRGEARFRMQTTPQHAPEDLSRAAKSLAAALRVAEREALDVMREAV